MSTATTLPWIEEASTHFVDIMPGHIDRLSWSAEQLRAHQDWALADLVRTASTWSPFHRKRLAGVELDHISVDRLAELPVMTKAEMMADLDEVFTDRRLTQGVIERHIATLGEEPHLLLDEYAVLATGGSSGTRGVFVIPRDQAAHFTAYVLRAGMAQLSATTGWPPPSKIPVGIVMAPSAIHATRSMTRAMSAVAHITYAPVTLPLPAITDRLNQAQPMVLVGFPSVMAQLGDSAAAGDVQIQPQMLLTTAEQLLPDQIQRITTGFGLPPGNSFGSTEGLVGTAPPGSDEFTFASDRAIIEFVDADDQPVPAGTKAHHILITNLISHTQPLIRYRMDDAMTELPPASGHGHQRATVEGRNDELLTIGNTTIHPLTFRSALLKHETIAEYQVRVKNTTANPRVELALVTTGPTALPNVERDIAEALTTAGATAPVTATQVENLERNPATREDPTIHIHHPIPNQSVRTTRPGATRAKRLAVGLSALSWPVRLAWNSETLIMPVPDTTPEAARRQRHAVWAKTLEQRGAMAMELSETVRQLLIDGIRERNPGIEVDELRLRVIERLHGKALATTIEAARSTSRAS